MRLPPLFTLLSSLSSVGLVFVNIFAGETPATLTTLDMFTINVAQIANTQLNNGTGNGCNCVEFVNGTFTINGTALVNGSLAVNTGTLPISEYYSVYTITYCEGIYLPNYTSPDATPVLIKCSNPSLARRFNLVDIIENAIKRAGAELGVNLSLQSLDWPSGITNAFSYVESAGAAFIGFLIVGLASLLLATMAATLSMFKPSKTTTKFLFITSVVALLSLTICAGIATAILTIVVNGINANGDGIGVSAKQGNSFLATMWSSVALLFVATLITLSSLLVDLGRGSHAPVRQYDGYDMPPRPIRRKPAPYYMLPPDPRSSWDPYSSRRTLVQDDDYYQYGDEFR